MTRLTALHATISVMVDEDYRHEENSALKLLMVHELNKIWVNELCSLSSQFNNPDNGD
jgi:hypothetical protein